MHNLDGEAGPAVWYVDADNTTGIENGRAWATAFSSIQAAVDAASARGGEVWVAEGAYTATTDTVVTMAENVHLYGGFAGTETLREERDWTAHVTAIDGQNTRRCVIGANNATLDGFTITARKCLLWRRYV